MAVPAREIEALVRVAPTGSYARSIWFPYEWLTGKHLDLPDARTGTYVPVIDPERQWAIDGTNSPRHHVRNNLPGTPEFCPMVFRTKTLHQFVAVQSNPVKPRTLSRMFRATFWRAWLPFFD